MKVVFLVMLLMALELYAKCKSDYLKPTGYEATKVSPAPQSITVVTLPYSMIIGKRQY